MLRYRIPGSQHSGPGHAGPAHARARWASAACVLRIWLTPGIACLLLATLATLAGCAGHSAPPPGPVAHGPAPRGGPEVVASARSLIGTPYQYGGRTPAEGFDCSGLTSYVYALHGYALPRSTEGQLASGRAAPTAAPAAGDLVFFRVAKGSGGQDLWHVGIATGEGSFVHSPKSGSRVSESSLGNPYWRQTLRQARRVLP